MVYGKIAYGVGAVVWVVLASCSVYQDVGPVDDLGATPFTHGQVQLTLKKGQTTQAQVLETFGAPNVATRDGNGDELWTYQKYATVSRATSSAESFAWTVILLGGRSRRGGAASGTSSRTVTLIIRFNGDGIVEDFKSRTSSF
ncbi:MAG: hypothetical protein GDA54_07065 [Alphaproteobacteria bacterium GM7ARS4]|nr:hypothetical protein [Alphaproteobacteria bacterium GM7ARS4]